MTQDQIESHPDFQPTYRRWLSVCLAAGRDRAAAEERARGYATVFVGRRLERERKSRAYRTMHVGPPVEVTNA